MGKSLFEIASELRQVLEKHPARQNNLPQVRIAPSGEDKMAAMRHFGFVATDKTGVFHIEESGHPGNGNFFEKRLPNVLLPNPLAEVRISEDSAVGLPILAYGYIIDGSFVLPAADFDFMEKMTRDQARGWDQWRDLTPTDLQILENGLVSLLNSLKDQKDEIFITIPLPSPVRK
ncbi:hypothetical protein HZB78_00440 [Candidatus Collierbacteria bacterium]|nr:hypothetical protein [Candidatus Collierbacteria bacterium]